MQMTLFAMKKIIIKKKKKDMVRLWIGTSKDFFLGFLFSAQFLFTTYVEGCRAVDRINVCTTLRPKW